MSEALDFRRSVPFAGEYDVIIAGGGPAGCSAAIAAARLGAKVLLLESTGMLGGMGTAGLVPAWCPFTDRVQPVYRGIAWEVFERSWTPVTHPDPDRHDWVPIDPEQLKLVYDGLVVAAGVEIRFCTSLAAVEMQDARHVGAIVTSGKDGLLAWKARFYIDCTGDGDLAAWAGADFELPDAFQPATFCFNLSNVNEAAYLAGPTLHNGNPDSPIHRIVSGGRYPLLDDPHFCQSLIRHNTVGFNAGHLPGVDPTSSASLSAALLRGRRMARAYRDALKQELPERFGNAELDTTAVLPGIREGRRIRGEYTFTVDDYLARRSFEDEIGRNCYYIDVHGCADIRKFPRYQAGESHGIPYRCLVPGSLDNVLTAGRCISSDRRSNGSLRVMPVCLVTGQAAGTAAALLAETPGFPARQLDIAKLRSQLRADGAWFR